MLSRVRAVFGGAALRRLVRREAGNTLVLFPAAILILFGLGAIAIESANVFLATRRLTDIASAVANDGANTVLASGFYTDGGAAVPDRSLAEDRLAGTVARHGGSEVGLTALSCTFTEFDAGAPDPSGVLDAPRVSVSCSARIDAIFGSFLGQTAQRTITVSEGARSVRSS